MARAGETNLGTQGDLFLGQINNNGFYAHSDLRWVGVLSTTGADASNLTSGASTSATSPSVLYRTGDIVVYNSRIFVAQDNNDNVAPGLVTGSVIIPAVGAGSPTLASSNQIAASAAAWTEIGNDDVLGARLYSTTSGYLVNNLVYDSEGGLFVVIQEVAHTTTARTAAQGPGQNTTNYRRVGGSAVTVRKEFETFAVTPDGNGDSLRLTFPDAASKLAFVQYFLADSDYTQAQLTARTPITNRADLTFATINNGNLLAAVLTPPSNMDIRFNLINSAGTNTTLIQHYFQYATNNANGGPFYNGAGNTIFVANVNAGTGTFTGLTHITTQMYEGEITTGPTYIAGDHIGFDFNSNGTEVTLNVDQREISAEPNTAITYDSSTGQVGLDIDTNELEVNSSNQLAVNTAEGARTGGSRNDSGSGFETGPSGNTGLRIHIDDEADNILEASSSGLFVGDTTVVSADGTANPSAGITPGTARQQGSANIRTTRHRQGTGNDIVSNVSIEGYVEAASTGSAVSASVNVTRQTNGDIRVSGVPVASWAQNQTGGVTIPASKLPNITLGNTHTYTGTTTTTAAAILTQVLTNNGGQRDSTGAITWHVGDLLVIANTNTASGADTYNGIYAYVGTQQTAGNTPTLESQRTAGQSDSDLLMALFRNLVTSTSAGRPTINNDGGTATTLSTVNVDRVDALVKNSTVGGTPQTVNTQAHLQYNGSTDSTMLQVDLPTALADTAPVTQFINRMRIGSTSYIFGLEPPAPSMSYSGPGLGSNQSLYSSNTVTFAVPTTLSAPTGSFEGRPLVTSDYAIATPANADVSITGNSDSRALGTSRALPTINSISNTTNSVVTFASTPDLLVGQTFTIAGVAQTAVNGTYTVSSITGNAVTSATDNSSVNRTFTISAIAFNTTVATDVDVTFGTGHGLSTGDTFTITGATPAAYNQVYTVTLSGLTEVTATPTTAIPPGTTYTANSGSVLRPGTPDVTNATGTRSTDGATISAVRTSDTVVTTTVTIDEPQTNAGAQVATTTDNDVGFVPISGFNYTDVVSSNAPLVTYRDARSAPTISPTTVSRSVFDNSAQSVTLALRNSDNEIAAGSGYDVQGWQTRQGTSGAFGSVTAATGNTSNSIAVDFVTSRTYQYRFPMMTNPRNGQPNTNPTDRSIAFSFYTPFYLIANDTTPVLADLTAATQVTAANYNPLLTGSVYDNITVTGNPNDNIYLLVLQGLVPTVTRGGQTVSDVATQIPGAPGNTPGSPPITGANISRNNNAGTAVVYSVIQFGSLIGTSQTFNLVRP